MKSSAIVLRWTPSLVAGAVYLGFIVLWIHARNIYYPLLLYADNMANREPYGDLNAVMTAADCWRHGVNVYAPSACMHGGVYNYSPFMLSMLSMLSVTIRPGGTTIMGLAIGAIIIASVALLPPATSRAELTVRILAVSSSTVIFILETANFDNIMFLFVLGGTLLLNSRVAVFSYPVFLFAAACKFYPIALMLLLVRERLPVLLFLVVPTGIGLALFIVFYDEQLKAALNIIPGGLPFRGVFGALNLSFGLVLVHYLPVQTLEPKVPEFFYAVHHPLAPVFIVLGDRLLTIFGLIASVMSASRVASLWQGIERRRRMFFLVGAITLVFCFYVAQNLEYRAVFLLLLFPALWSMSQRERVMKTLLVCVLLLLWAEFMRHLVSVISNAALGPEYAFYPEFIFWLIRECIWWWVMIQLGAFIVCFLQQSIRPDMRDDRAAGLAMHG